MHFSSFALLLVAAATGLSVAELNVDNVPNTNSAASALAGKLMSYYTPNEDGVLPEPVHVWESGAMWTTMIQYWHDTGDTKYNDAVAAAINAQAGSGHDFLGRTVEGNDDQLWWGLTCMTAAEYNFQAPSSGPSWLQLAQNVYKDVAGRWDTKTCDGGLKRQIDPPVVGYNYKNSITNGLFFQLSARLAAYTGDNDYATSAEHIFEWCRLVGLINNVTYAVYDGTDDTTGCTSVDHAEWSYNVGVFLYGSAVMLNHTGDSRTWQPFVDGFISAAYAGFTHDGVLQETNCEPAGHCNTDQLSYKAYLSRWLANTAALVPSTVPAIAPVFYDSVEGAIASCNGGPNSDTCGTKWTTHKYDGSTGVGQQMSALEIVQGLLVSTKSLPKAASKPVMARTFQA